MKLIFTRMIILCSLNLVAYSQWVPQMSVTTANLYDVKFVSRQLGWIVGNGVILRTQDAGSSWTAQNFNGLVFISASFIDSNIGWAVGGTTAGHSLIMKTENGGAIWVVKDSSYGNSFWGAVYFVDSLHGWIAGGGRGVDTTGIILRTIDGGGIWARVDSGKVQNLNDIFFIDTLKGWACGEYGAIYKSTDGGLSWQPSFRATYSSITEPLRKIQFATRDSGWAVGGIGGVETKVRTSDGSLTWQISNVFGPPTYGSSLHGLWFSDSKKGWAVGGANAGLRILWTTDGGVSWVIQSHGLTSTAGIDYFESVYMISPNEGWIVGSKGTILRTTNGGVTDVPKMVDVLPSNFELSQNYPNPFNPSTKIKYAIPIDANVRLAIYDVLGREIKVLEEGRKLAGFYSVEWDGRDKSGHEVPSGVYFYRLQTNNLELARKLMIVR